MKNIDSLVEQIKIFFRTWGCGRIKVKDIRTQLGITDRQFRLLKEQTNKDFSNDLIIGTDNYGVFEINNKQALKKYLNYNRTLIKALKEQNKNAYKKFKKTIR